METETPSGLIIERAAFPRDNPPNANEPGGTVGPNAEEGKGATHVMYPRGSRAPQVQAWAGWPTEWATPEWGGAFGRLSSHVDTVSACLDLNSSILSTMPADRITRGYLDDPPTWLDNPCPPIYADWSEFLKQVVWSYLLGEAFIWVVERGADGYPRRFIMLEPWMVSVDIIDGIREYRINGEPISRHDICHLRYSSWPNRPRGFGPLEAAGARLTAAAALISYASDIATRGGIPWGVLTHPAQLTDSQVAKLQEQWLDARLDAMGLPAVLSGGVTLETLQLSPSDIALQEMQQFNESRLAVLLGVPPHLVGLPAGGDSMTYGNVTSYFDHHWRASLRPKATSIMRRLSNWLLPRGSVVELDRDEYVRPPLAERATAYSTLFGLVDEEGNRAITIDEIRDRERFRRAEERPTP